MQFHVFLFVLVTVLSSYRKSDRVATERTPTLSVIITGDTVNVSSVPPVIIRSDLIIMIIIFVLTVLRNGERSVLVENFVYCMCPSLLECFLNSSVPVYSVFSIGDVYSQELLGAPCYPVIAFISN